jgi:hypothetical protein
LAFACARAHGQTAGWEFPTTNAVTVGAADNNKVLASDNVPGTYITVTLPTPSVVGSGWMMGFSTANGHGVVVNTPSNVYIYTGQKQMTSFSTPSNVNYEYLALMSDGVNFRLLTATHATQMYNGIVGAVGGDNWVRINSAGYSATLKDNGTTLIPAVGIGADVTVTLPSAPLLPNGWAITVHGSNQYSLTVVPNPVQGGVMANTENIPVASYTVAPAAAAIVQFDGGGWRVYAFASHTVPTVADNAGLNQLSTGKAPTGVWRLNYTASRATTTNESPPTFYVPAGVPCTLGGGTGDGGQQVPAINNDCWIARLPPGPFDVRVWGADQANADNYSYITAALAVAGIKCDGVFFPKGHFHVHGQLVVPSCVSFVGSGRDGTLNLNGQGTILDFAGSTPPGTAAIVAGSKANVSEAVDIGNMQVEGSPGDCMDVGLGDSNVHDLNLLSCAGQGLVINATARTTYRNIMVSGNGNHGISLNGDPTSNGANIGTSVFETVSSQSNSLTGYYLNYANTITFIGSLAKLNGYQGFDVANSRTITMIGAYAKNNGRVGYLYDGSDGELIGARAESNNTTHAGVGDFIVATNGSNLGVLYGSDDLAPSGTSIYVSKGSLVHTQGTLLAGQQTVDASSIADIYAFYYPGATITMGGAILGVGQCVSNTVTMNGVRMNSPFSTVTVTPSTYPGNGFWWNGIVTADNTVTVNLCSAVSGTPAISTYKIRVFQ